MFLRGRSFSAGVRVKHASTNATQAAHRLGKFPKLGMKNIDSKLLTSAYDHVLF
jgi:hypothetical protein